MANAVIYARFSCSKQREESIEDQVRICTDAAVRAGDMVVRIYADSAASGRTDARPQFLRMMADAERGEWSRVYVYKTDRFARNRYDSAVYKARLRKLGVALVSATENVGDGPEGILLESLLEGMAEYYSANLAQNVKRGMDGNAAKCKANGSSIYGYRRGTDGYYEIVEPEAAVVRKLFKAYVEGRTVTEICGHELKPYRTRRGNPISVQTACKMLRNERYTGVYIFGDTRIEGGMPAIVTKETYDAAQARLKSKGRRRSVLTAGFPLTGLLVDGDGNQYYGTSGTSRNGKTYRYYTSVKTGVYIPADDLERHVAEAVDVALSPENRQRVIDAVMIAQERQGAKEYDEADDLQRRLAKCEGDIRRTVDAIAETGINDDLAEKLKDLQALRQELKDALAEVKRSVPLLTREMVEFWLWDKCRELDADSLVPALVSRVSIDGETMAGVVEFGLLPENIQFAWQNIQKGDVREYSTPVCQAPKTKTPSQVGGCSDHSKLVDGSLYHTNKGHLIIPIAYGFGVTFSAA